jgi:hypothetical protein
MALFRLRSQRTGTIRDFSLLDILNNLGDTVNDEIGFGEDVYNLSSFAALNSDGGNGNNGNGGSAPGNLYTEYPQVLDGRLTVSLERPPATILTVLLNGLELREGADYSRDGRIITFPYMLVSNNRHQDSVKAVYDFSAVNPGGNA